jgi:Flp pilus assembly protein TadG
MTLLKKLRRDKKGNVAMLFALALVPMAGFVGLSVDYSRKLAATERLQSAIDAATLSGASLPSETPDSEVKAKVEQALDETSDNRILNSLSLDVEVDSASVTVNANGLVASSFTRVLGFESIPVNVVSVAQRPRTALADIALVLDNTGSMNDPAGGGVSKLQALKDSTKNLIAELESSFIERKDDVRVSLVPFSLGVRMRPVDATMRRLVNPRPSVGWTGCVTDRASNYDVQGSKPVNGNSATYFQRNRVIAPNGIQCPGAAAPGKPEVTMEPMTNYGDFSSLKQKIDWMSADGWTNAPVGLYWGRQSIIENGLLPGGYATSKRDLTRYVILLTDGDNTKSSEFDQPNGAKSNPDNIDDKMIAMCTAMRNNDGIIIYTIGFGSGISNEAKAKLLQCAGSVERAKLAVSASDLNTVFRQIASDVKKTRLTR